MQHHSSFAIIIYSVKIQWRYELVCACVFDTSLLLKVDIHCCVRLSETGSSTIFRRQATPSPGS